MSIEMRVGRITKGKQEDVWLDSATIPGRWAIQEVFRCMRHSCNWPAMKLLKHQEAQARLMKEKRHDNLPGSPYPAP